MQTDAALDAMIDTLANKRTMRPQVAKGSHGEVPLFGADYDSDEQNRVYAALREVVKSSGNRMWPRLIAHFADERYAFTFGAGGRHCTNATVGMLCQLIAEGDLIFAYQRHAPRSKPMAGIRLPLVGVPRELMGRGAIVLWCEKHSGKQLYELQIELCEWAITDAAAVEKMSEEQRKSFIEDVKKQIGEIKETKQAVVDLKRFSGEQYARYSAKTIKEAREKHSQEENEKGKRQP